MATDNRGNVGIKIVENNNNKECNPVNFFTYLFTGSTLISIIWTFYSVAIEILPKQIIHNDCSNKIIYSNWTPYENSACEKYLNQLRSYDEITGSTFWSLMIIAGVSPWIVFCIIATIMSHEKVTKQHKQCMMVILGFMIAVYFLTMLFTAAAGIHVYLYSSPAYIGVPQIIIIPSLLGYMKKINISKKFMKIINPVVIILYIMISVSLVILSSYIVWTPSTFKDLLYKSKILLGCAWYFAWLAAVIMCIEMFYMYAYNKYPEIEDYKINTVTIQKSHDLTIDSDNNERMTFENIEQNILQEKIRQESLMNKKKIYIPILGHYVSLFTNLILVSWLSMSNSSANITILALITVFPFLGNIAIQLQKPFNQFIVSRNK